MAMGDVERAQRVFLNVPFDVGYEKLLLALIASLACLGRRPRCVLEIPESGQGRLSRLFEQIGQCGASVHDLSRVGQPARFNMPFELGLACAVQKYSTHGDRHSYFLLESQRHRLDKTLSDIKGRDPLIHEGKPHQIMGCMLEVFGGRVSDPTVDQIYALWRRLLRIVRDRKHEHHQQTIYSRQLFLLAVGEATTLAAQAGFIGPANGVRN